MYRASLYRHIVGLSYLSDFLSGPGYDSLTLSFSSGSTGGTIVSCHFFHSFYFLSFFSSSIHDSTGAELLLLLLLVLR